jgi:hypothetical protein
LRVRVSIQIHPFKERKYRKGIRERRYRNFYLRVSINVLDLSYLITTPQVRSS